MKLRLYRKDFKIFIAFLITLLIIIPVVFVLYTKIKDRYERIETDSYFTEGFSFSYPKGWTINNTDFGIYVGDDELTKTDVYLNIELKKNSLENVSTDSCREYIKTLDNTSSNLVVKIQDLNVVKIDNRLACQFKLQTSSDDFFKNSFVYYIPISSTEAYVIAASMKNNKVDPGLKIIMDSFRVE